MKVKLVSDETQFWDLKEAWKKLQSLGAVKDITVTWEWMSIWWEVFKNGRSLAVLVVKDGEEVIGIAPFIRRKMRYFRLISYIRMEFMASGEDERDEIYSNYLNFIIRDGQEREVLETIFEYLCYSRDIKWNEILLPRMDIQSPVIPLLFDLAKKFRLSIGESWRIPCLYINLPTSFEEYLSQLGRKKRQDVRRGMRRLGEMGNVRFEIAETKEEVETAKETLIRLHQSRWSQKGKPGVFSSDRFRLFHDEMISIAHRENWLRLGTLFLDEKPLACVYNLQFMNKIYGYQLGIVTGSVSETSHSGYGSLVLVHAISHAISEGIKEYDFLAGASDYKRRLAKKQREIVTLRISKSSPKESIYKTICRIKEQMKIVRDHFLRKRRNGE